jgi:phthiodiolone/phenolphthiodiolone dimycocerosates ketoreductase
MLKKVNLDSLLAIVPHGSSKQIARILKGYIDAGLRVPKILDYGSMAGLKYAARSAQKVLDAEDELMRLVG